MPTTAARPSKPPPTVRVTNSQLLTPLGAKVVSKVPPVIPSTISLSHIKRMVFWAAIVSFQARLGADSTIATISSIVHKVYNPRFKDSENPQGIRDTDS
jgi:hypothetical protein